jgi:hypothetical protein
MARSRLALVCALGALLVIPQTAAAGGWWSYIDVNRSNVATGQRVTVNATVLFRSVAAAEEARQPGRFSVYLLRGLNDSIVERAMRTRGPGDWWTLGDAETIRVGDVSVRVSAANFGRVSAEFTVPELSPGTYDLMLCEAGCAEPLADVIPAEGFTVVADPATAQLAQRVDRLQLRLRKQAARLAAGRLDAKSALAAARDARSDMEQLESTVSSADEGGSSPRGRRWAYVGWLVAGVLIGTLVLGVIRRRPSQPPRVAGHPTDEELHELLSTEQVHRH